MKHVKVLSLLAIAAAALMAFAGTASATAITSPEGTTYTGFLSATSWNSEIDGSFVTVKCESSYFHGEVASHGGVVVSGSISKVNFAGCNYAVNVKNTGIISVDSSNVVRSTGMDFEIKTSVGTCIFGTLGTEIGSITEGKWADLDINSAKVSKITGSFLCGSSMTWTGDYQFSTPNDMWVD
jgi:hypothetical protein